jgi:hypothetical protein
VTEGEEKTHADGSLPVLHELPGRVVDGRDVIRIDGMAKSKSVCRDPEAKQNRVSCRCYNDREPRSHVENGEERVDDDQSSAQVGRRHTPQLSYPFEARDRGIETSVENRDDVLVSAGRKARAMTGFLAVGCPARESIEFREFDYNVDALDAKIVVIDYV